MTSRELRSPSRSPSHSLGSIIDIFNNNSLKLFKVSIPSLNLQGAISTLKYPLKKGDIVIFDNSKIEDLKNNFFFENYDDTISPLDPYFTISFKDDNDLKEFLKENFSSEKTHTINILYKSFKNNPLKKIDDHFSSLIKYNPVTLYKFIIGKHYFKKSEENDFLKKVCKEIYVRCFYLIGMNDNDIKEYLYGFNTLFIENRVKGKCRCDKAKMKKEKDSSLFPSERSFPSERWCLSCYNPKENFIQNIILYIKYNPYIFLSNENLCDKIFFRFHPKGSDNKLLKEYSKIYKNLFKYNDFCMEVKREDIETFDKKILRDVYNIIIEESERSEPRKRSDRSEPRERSDRRESKEKENDSNKFFLYLGERYVIERNIKEFLKGVPVEDKNISSSYFLSSLKEIENKKLVVISGGPGTGKTTLITKIESTFKTKSILFLSYTGKAVCKIREKVVNKEACNTIHLALNKNKKNTYYDIIIIDETSMVNATLFNEFLKHFKFNLLILIGDNNQLPPIEWGNIFSYIIEKTQGCYINLTINHRQNEYLNNVVTTFKENSSFIIDDKYIYKYKNKDELREYIKGLDPYKYLFLTPLNEMCDFVNKIFSKGFENGERVIVNENMYIKASGASESNILIPNGIIGTINGDKIKVKDTDEDFYLKRNETTYGLCYCLTVHKMQGSECDNLIFILPYNSLNFLTKNLFYTAISRPKKRLIILTDINNLKEVIRKKFL